VSPAVSVDALPRAKSAQQPSTAGSRGVAQTNTGRNATPAASSTAQRKPATSANDSARSSSSARTARVATTSSAELPPPSEVTLLRNAQVALQSRPREAFQLTQQHRRLYPAGEFAQERDALAIQALMRAGETDQARELAQAFIRAYPTSPHAHRFREAMGIH
jgi:TolA-binding protein